MLVEKSSVFIINPKHGILSHVKTTLFLASHGALYLLPKKKCRATYVLIDLVHEVLGQERFNFNIRHFHIHPKSARQDHHLNVRQEQQMLWVPWSCMVS